LRGILHDIAHDAFGLHYRASGRRKSFRERRSLASMSEIAIEQLRLRVDGHALEVVRIAGVADAPAIVLLHEGLGSIAMWRDFPSRLHARTGRTVMAYSRWGYGDSDPLTSPRPIDYMQREGEVVLPDLLAQLGLERAVVFGHSDGASIALIAAGARPDLCAALILEAPHVVVEDVSIRSIAQARVAWQTTNLRERLARYHADPAGAFFGWNDVWLDARFRDWNIEAYAERVTCPVLLVQGENDEYGTLDQLARIMRHVPGAQSFVLPGAGHSPHREDPDAVIDRVGVFLDERCVD
jgi:pimeloyl-ACP methyl ester carboxylesterase